MPETELEYNTFTYPKETTIDVVVPVYDLYDPKKKYLNAYPFPDDYNGTPPDDQEEKESGYDQYTGNKNAPKKPSGAPPTAPASTAPRVDPTKLITQGFHHSSFLSGGTVSCAGEIKCKNGVLELISNVSGHYRPPEEYLQQVFMEFNDLGYDFSKAVDMELATHGAFASTIKKVDTKANLGFRKGLLENKKSRSYTPDQKNVAEVYKDENIASKTVGMTIRYLKPDELKKLQLKVENKVVKQDGKPFNTYGGLIFGRPLMRDRFIFVMSKDGEIYAADVLKMMGWAAGPASENYKKDIRGAGDRQAGVTFRRSTCSTT